MWHHDSYFSMMHQYSCIYPVLLLYCTLYSIAAQAVANAGPPINSDLNKYCKSTLTMYGLLKSLTLKKETKKSTT